MIQIKNKYLFKNNHLRFKQQIISSIKKGEILVKINYAGICGTDLDMLRNTRDDKAKILGHEGIGTVIEIGDEIISVNIGDKIVFNPVNPSNQDDILGHSKDGIFQNYYILSNKDLSQVLVLKENIDIQHGALIEPLGTAVYGNELIDSRLKTKTIAIVGTGAIGLINAIYAKSLSKSVFLINKSQKRLDFAIKNKIASRRNTLLDSDNLVDEIMKRTDNKGVDAVFLCTNREGALNALAKATKYVKEKGCINMVGGIQTGDSIPEIDYKDLNKIRRLNVCGITKKYAPLVKANKNKLIYLTGHRGTSKKHLRTAINLLKQNDIYLRVITHEVKFADMPMLIDNVLSNKCKKTYIKGSVLMH